MDTVGWEKLHIGLGNKLPDIQNVHFLLHFFGFLNDYQ